MAAIEYLSSTDSTNNHLKRLLSDGVELNNLHTVYTFYQTAGRGQAGNSWESENGKNLLFSTIIKPQHLYATEQFRLSMLVSIAIVTAIKQTLKQYLGTSEYSNSSEHHHYSNSITIKWPNDIYVGDRKLVGILIENYLAGPQVMQSIVGIGINVNQTDFRSDAPNPVSLKQLTGLTYDLDHLLSLVIKHLKQLLPLLDSPAQLKAQYMSLLYRADDFYPYLEREVSLTPVSIVQSTSNLNRGRQTEDSSLNSNVNHLPFMARIHDILHTGQLVLQLQDGSLRTFHFKQLRYIITPKH